VVARIEARHERTRVYGDAVKWRRNPYGTKLVSNLDRLNKFRSIAIISLGQGSGREEKCFQLS
jgi:hypothetical protein